MMKSIEEQIRILASRTEEVSATVTGAGAGATAGRRHAFRWVFAGANLALALGIVIAILLVQPGGSVEVSTATTPPPASDSPIAEEQPGPPGIPSVESRLVRDDVTDRWTVQVGSRDGVAQGHAVINSDSELIGLLASPSPDRTDVHVGGEPGFELDAFVAVHDTEAPDQSGTTTVEGTVRSTEAGQTVFVVPPGRDHVELVPGMVAAASGGPGSPVHGKIPIGVIRSAIDDGDDATSVYVVDVAEPVEGPVSILLVRDPTG